MTGSRDLEPQPGERPDAGDLLTGGGVQPRVCWSPPGVGGDLSTPLARFLLQTHTAVSDVVIDVDDDVTFAAAARDTGRSHHALGGASRIAALAHAAGYIEVILLHWPRATADPRLLLLACRSLLRHAGVVVVAARLEPGRRVSHLNALSGVAGTAGLRLVDHIVGMEADGGVATSVATRRPAADQSQILARAAGEELPAVHTDLLVFSPAAGSRCDRR